MKIDRGIRKTANLTELASTAGRKGGPHQKALALLVGEVLWKRHMALHQGTPIRHSLPALIPEQCTPSP